MGEVLKFVTLDKGLGKKWPNLKTFLVKFWFEKPVLSSAKRAQNTHKKNWRVQATVNN